MASAFGNWDAGEWLSEIAGSKTNSWTRTRTTDLSVRLPHCGGLLIEFSLIPTWTPFHPRFALLHSSTLPSPVLIHGFSSGVVAANPKRSPSCVYKPRLYLFFWWEVPPETHLSSPCPLVLQWTRSICHSCQGNVSTRSLSSVSTQEARWDQQCAWGEKSFS